MQRSLIRACRLGMCSRPTSAVLCSGRRLMSTAGPFSREATNASNLPKSSNPALAAIPQPLYNMQPPEEEKYIANKFLKMPKTAAIVGAPMALGQPQLGVDLGPSVIRKGGLAKRLEVDQWRIDDRGDVDFSSCLEDGKKMSRETGNKDPKDSPLALNSLAVGQANYRIYKAVREAAKTGSFTLNLGGDHSMAIGTIAGLLSVRPDTSILWVDAHADINTPTASGSKNIHGMVLSFLMDLDGCRDTTPGFEWLNREKIPFLNPARLAYVGLRDVDWGERQIIANLGIQAYSMHDVDRLGINTVMDRALHHLLGRRTIHGPARPLHLTFDIDSIDPMFAPSTGTRVSGGLTYREAYFICERAASSQALASMDIVEVNPQILPEGQDKTVEMAVGLCACAMGNTIL